MSRKTVKKITNYLRKTGYLGKTGFADGDPIISNGNIFAKLDVNGIETTVAVKTKRNYRKITELYFWDEEVNVDFSQTTKFKNFNKYSRAITKDIRRGVYADEVNQFNAGDITGWVDYLESLPGVKDHAMSVDGIFYT